MRFIRPALMLGLLLPPAAAAQAAPPPPRDRWFYGGGLALSIGDVDFVSISPLICYRITRDVSAGIGLEYIYRDDSRYAESYSTSDYGGSVFAHYYVWEGVFLSASYEYLRFEYFDIAGNRLSDGYSSVFVGGGFSQPMGENAAFIISAMYNVSYESDEPSPYDSPWLMGAGVSVGF